MSYELMKIENEIISRSFEFTNENISYFYYKTFRPLREKIILYKEGTWNIEKYSPQNIAVDLIGINANDWLEAKKIIEKEKVKSITSISKEFNIEYNHRSTLKGFKNGKETWSFRIQGYLYTSITFLKEQFIVFGTAGQGGGLYIVELETGNLMFHENTKGTVNYLIKNDFIYFADENNNLVILDTKDYTVKRIKGQKKLQIGNHSFIMRDQKLYTIATRRNRFDKELNKWDDESFLICFDVSETTCQD